MKYFVIFVIAYILGVISGNLYRDVESRKVTKEE